tara:strand:- start:252 stop:482 length:231 start_codon:yes stop_codon:yes gene_type:complete
MSDREIMDSKFKGENQIHKFIKQNQEHMPDQKWHKIVSFIKSGIRIVGYCFIPFNLGIATSLLISSEIVGIVEELV